MSLLTKNTTRFFESSKVKPMTATERVGNFYLRPHSEQSYTIHSHITTHEDQAQQIQLIHAHLQRCGFEKLFIATQQDLEKVMGHSTLPGIRISPFCVVTISPESASDVERLKTELKNFESTDLPAKQTP